MTHPEIHVLPDPDAVAHAAAERVVRLANEAVEDRGAFTIVLAGGTTPRTLYERLAGEPYASQVEWPQVEIFFGDERTVPPDHPHSNYRMASETLLSKVPIPPSRIHRIRGEIDPNEAAIEYGRMLKERFGDGGPDLVLLGMGDDGHTASLFPHTEALGETTHRAVANRVDALDTTRVTLTAPFFNLAMNVLVLVTGADKAARLSDVLEGPRDPQRFPIQLIDPLPPGRLTWLLDAAAAGMFDDE